MRKLLKTMRKRKVLSSFLLFTLLVVGAASGYAAFLMNKWNHALDQIAAPIAPASNEIDTSNYPVSQTSQTSDATEKEEKSLTLLLTAIDERSGSEGSLNTDVMMLFRIDPVTHQGTVVSIPRDLEVSAEKSGLETSHKANYFYAYNYNKNKETALDETKQLFSKIYQVPIDHMAVINFDGFRKLIDQLGGMTVDVDMDMKYQDESDGTNINLNKGTQRLNGKQVLDYIRYRKSNMGTAESSDLERNQREQFVLNELLDKLTSLNGVTAWGKVLDIMGSSIKTDIPADELRTLTKSYREYKPANVQYIHLDGTWESPYLVVKQQDLEEALEALRGQTDSLNNSSFDSSIDSSIDSHLQTD
ncbi:LCP family protein [Paenibacillus sp. CGMCC 1.16610]|uniref:LytR family transcriptional regulator n=1 Tax=Paenibacillus anseongense TaxID=2682845 RepID=A0ABW9U7P7_9BACL|nr:MULTISPECIES: LCP family protein [Paenibacillus]MBA2942301.1 LCP family protein [Paenibacillus sp. CGMCC 1.16610]MVQ36132.1 LytR family transcriptional regulator [Paenibacillus anseongense]